MDWASNLLTLLGGVSLRALLVAALAYGALGAMRLRSEAARHAVWTLVALGMLLSLALTPWLPPIPLRVWHSPARAAAGAPAPAPTGTALPAIPAGDEVVCCRSELSLPPLPVDVVVAPPPSPAPAPTAIPWLQLLAAAYGLGTLVFLLRLAFAYAFTWSLVRRSRLVEEFAERNVHQSDWVAVPMTVGWLRPRIVLPPDWRAWDQAKLDAVLAHERAHIARADWIVAAMAALNRSVFWFHPLAWWLERTLARSAEQACDDAVLRRLGLRQQYARVLLEMAAQVKLGRGRMVWEAMAMAKATEVRVRIDRILDETRPIPAAWNRARWAALVGCGVPFICLVTALQLAPARAMEQQSTVAGPAAEASPAAPVAAQSSPPEAGVSAAREATRPPSREPSRAARPFVDPSAHAATRLRAYLSPMPEPPPTRSPVLGLGLVAMAPLPPQAPADSLQPAKTVSPRYPEAARAARVEGIVQLTITVGMDGTVTDVTSATGHPLLVPAAAEAVRQWVYPARSAEARFQVAVPVRPDPSAPAPAAASRPGLHPGLTMLYRKEAQYPKIARQTGAQGPVALDVTIGTDGHVKAAKVLSGHPMLANAAVEAVKQWRYYPPDSEVTIPVTVNFVAPASQQTGGQNGGQVAPAPNAANPGAAHAEPRLIYRKEPEYPKIAQQTGAGGTVVLEATIGTDGHVKAVKVLSGHPMLTNAAVEAVKQWVYSPLEAEVATEVRLNFGGQAPARTGGQITQAQLISRKGAVYPKEAKEAGVTGDVKLAITIGKDGLVTNVKVLSGHPLLAQAAEDAVRQWVYKPTLLNGQPVETESSVMIHFVGDGTPAPPSASPSGPPAGRLQNAVLIYRKDAQAPQGVSGVVRARATIGKDGRVNNVQVPEGDARLRDAAIEAIRQWRYRPAMQNGEPVESDVEITVNFTERR